MLLLILTVRRVRIRGAAGDLLGGRGPRQATRHRMEGRLRPQVELPFAATNLSIELDLFYNLNTELVFSLLL